ncbi:MAG: diaminopimelate decarboxylase family protein [Christensenellales bacterium]
MAERRDLINAEGHLMFGGCDTVMLAKTYGTPLYVVDGAMVEEKMLECRQAMAQCFDSYKVFYASKALCAKAIYKLAEKTGLHLDVVSAGELKMALESGMPGERIALHGNVKLYPELSMAAENGCTVNIDSIEEIEDVQAVAAEKGTVVPVLVRVTPGVEAHTHAYIQTGIEDCKFALGIENGMAMEAIRRILACKNLSFRGIHGHIGSQILESEPYYPTGKNLAAFALKWKETGAKAKSTLRRLWHSLYQRGPSAAILRLEKATGFQKHTRRQESRCPPSALSRTLHCGRRLRCIPWPVKEIPA